MHQSEFTGTIRVMNEEAHKRKEESRSYLNEVTKDVTLPAFGSLIVQPPGDWGRLAVRWEATG